MRRQNHFTYVTSNYMDHMFRKLVSHRAITNQVRTTCLVDA